MTPVPRARPILPKSTIVAPVDTLLVSSIIATSGKCSISVQWSQH